jgi:hypothetical protein
MKRMAILLALPLAAPLCAIASDCDDAIDSYNSAVSEITYALRRYANCVSNSDGKDDCASEFRRLKNAQSEFESAVSDVDSYCED